MDLKKHARAMRRAMTDAERKLWFAVRDRRLAGWKFRRQVPIGPYIVDFVCKEAGLVIEVDGGQHSERVRDRVRDADLRAAGYAVVRVWNNEVLDNLDGVLERLRTDLSARPATAPHPDPLPGGERE